MLDSLEEPGYHQYKTMNIAAGGSIEAVVDPRIELLAAVAAATGGNPCSVCAGSAYLERLRSWADASHPAAVLFGKMTPADWRHRHPSLILMDFGLPPQLEVRAYRDHYLNAGKDDAVARFMRALRDLALRDDFMARFKREKCFYEELTSCAQARWPGSACLEEVNAYLGLSKAVRYHFLLAPLYHGAVEHNVLYRRDDGSFDIYSVVGHTGVESGRPLFALSTDELSGTVWHEVAHTVVDEVTQEHAEALMPLRPLYGLMSGLAREKYRGPGGWLHMVDEHVIRAVTSRLALRRGGEQAGRQALLGEKKEGFSLVGPVYELLGDYEAERGRYPTIKHFYPRIVELFRRLHQGAWQRASKTER